MLPLHSFFGLLGVKYIAALVIASAVFTVLMRAFGSGGPTVLASMLSDTIALTAILLTLTFTAFVVYRISNGEDFRFFSMAGSAAFVFFLAALAISVRDVISGNSDFHILQVMLPLIASLSIGVVFSGLVKVVQKLIEG